MLGPVIKDQVAAEAEARGASGRFETLEVSPGAPVFRAGDPAEHVFRILSGTARVYGLLSDGRRQIFAFPTIGAVVGACCGRWRCCTAEAVDRLLVSRFPRKLTASIPQDMQEILRASLRSAYEHMLLLGRKTMAERLAWFLMERSLCEGSPELPALWFHLPMTRFDIGDHLGMTFETVSRTFARIRQAGLIQLDTPASVRIRDFERLKRLAGAESSAKRRTPSASDSSGEGGGFAPALKPGQGHHAF